MYKTTNDGAACRFLPDGLLARDERAPAEVRRLYGGAVIAVACRVVGNRSDAGDVAQDASIWADTRDGVPVVAHATEIHGTAETHYGSSSDGDLVAAVMANREEAFNELFRRHSQSVTAVARMILGNRPECDDVVSEVFIELWRKPEAFQPDRGSLLTFLRVKARGRSIDMVRSDVARTRREKRGSNVVVAPGVEPDVLAAESAAQLHRALASLPRDERELIELAYFSGMTYREVAVHLNLPEGTVKSRIRAGLSKLRVNEQIRTRDEEQ